MRSGRTPNHLLRDLLRNAEWTGQDLARRVNALGAETGLSLRYDRTSVAHWLSGARPRSPVPELVAEGLSRRFGRCVTVVETGLVEACGTDRDAGSRPWWEWGTVNNLAELAGVGIRRRDVLSGGTYCVAALAVPGCAALAELIAVPPTDRNGSAGRVGRTEASAAAAMLRLFAEADDTFGGGQPRGALSSYLASTIGPWLRAAAAPAIHRQLLITAAGLSYLCGFMFFDENLHAPAQRYYLTGLRLAAEAGDALTYGITLRALSVQARLLGHRQQAVRLAGEAVDAAAGRACDQTRAFLHGQLAVAHAAAGNHRDALDQLGAAETHLSRATSSAQPPAQLTIGGYHLAAFTHCQAATTACLGDRRTAIRALQFSIRHRPADEPRSLAITQARLAELQFADGQWDQACGTWREFLDRYPKLRSRRADSALSTLLARTNPYRNRPVLGPLYHQAVAVRGATKAR